MLLTTKKAQAIYADHDIMIDDIDAALVALNCNAQAENSSKTAEDWAHVWAAAESNTTDLTYAEASRGH